MFITVDVGQKSRSLCKQLPVEGILREERR